MGDGYVVHLTSTSDYPGAGSSSIGSSVGSSVGSSIGSSVGSSVGSSIGSILGSSVGSSIGSSIGSILGSSVGSLLCEKGVVKMERLTHVAGDCMYRVNNQLDKELKPLPVEQILSSAKRMVGKTLPYDIIKSNCEHFVTKLRYGEPRSLQVENAVIAGAQAGALGVFALAADNLAQFVMRNWSHPSDSLKKPQDPALEAAEQRTAPTSPVSLTPALGQPAVRSLALLLSDRRMEKLYQDLQ
ncbi:phospholipase A and acyltransferase 4-like isoform X2 [Phyllostomus hastatus]|nr:phospholipase A and acyltransferase 4-like isoform X2 [Phyllostomus hastatus]